MIVADPDRIRAMLSSETSLSWRAPRWVQVCLSSLLIAGIFAMHNFPAYDHDGHGTQEMTESVVHAASSVTVAAVATAGSVSHHAESAIRVVVAAGGDMGLSMSDCGGLMMLCMAMMLGISAYILIRKRMFDRLLWQLPPPQFTVFGRVTPPFQRLTPLQRSSVLRR